MFDHNVKGGPSTGWSRLKDPIAVLSGRRPHAVPGGAAEPRPGGRGGVETGFAAVAIVGGLAGAVGLWVVERSVSLSLYALCVFVVYVGIGLGDVATGKRKLRRFLAFTLFPVAATLILFGAYQLWEMWWLAAVLGLVVGFVVWALLVGWLFPDVLADGRGAT